MSKNLQEITSLLPEFLPLNAKKIFEQKLKVIFHSRGADSAQKYKEKVETLIKASESDIPVIGPKVVYCLSEDSEAALKRAKNVAAILRREKVIEIPSSKLKLNSLDSPLPNQFFGQLLMELSRIDEIKDFAEVALILTELQKGPCQNQKDILTLTKMFDSESLKAFNDKGIGFPLDLSNLLIIFTCTSKEAKPYVEKLSGAIFDMKPSDSNEDLTTEEGGKVENIIDTINFEITPKLYNFQAPTEFVDEIYQLCFESALLETFKGMEPNKIAAKMQFILSSTSKFSNCHISIVSTPHFFSNPINFIQFYIFDGCFILFHEIPSTKPPLELKKTNVKYITSFPENFGKTVSNGKSLEKLFRSMLNEKCGAIQQSFSEFEEKMNESFFGAEKLKHKIAVDYCNLEVQEKLEVQHGPDNNDKITVTFRQSTYSTDLCRSAEIDAEMAEKLKLIAEETIEPLKTALLTVAQMIEDGKNFDKIREEINTSIKSFNPEIFENFGHTKFGVLTYLPKRGQNLSYFGNENAKECVIGDLGVVVFMCQ
uniref:Uncharacterized protein n=1 Tax=Panagrolaimus sp. PS1159 TaxID=55785 RepID=A0AC35FMG5_9BILA